MGRIKHRRKVRRAVAAAVAGSLLALAGCTGAPGTQAEPAGTIRMLTPIFERPGAKTELEGVLEKFSEKYPEVEVKVDYTDYSKLNEKLATSLAGGRPYDVMMMGVGWIPPFAARGVLAELEQDRTKLEETYYPRTLDGGSYDGKIYALPVILDLRCVIYRKDMLAEAGLTQPPKDFQQLRQYAAKLAKRKDGELVRMGLDLFDLRTSFETFLYANGGQLFNADATKPAFNSPEGVEALQVMVDLVRKDKAIDADMLKQPGQVSWPIIQDRAAMMMGHNKVRAQILQDKPELIEDDNIGCFLLENKRKAMFLGGTLAAMSAKTRHKEAARALVDLVAGEEGSMAAARAQGALPSVRSALESDLVQDNDFARLEFENIEYAFSEGGPPAWLEIRGNFQAGIEEALRGSKSPKQALDELAAEAEQAMNR